MNGSIESQVEAGLEKGSTKLSESVFAKFKAWWESTRAEEPAKAGTPTVAELQGQIAELTKSIEARDAEIKTLKDAAAKAESDAKAKIETAEKDLEQKANTKAGEKLAKAGHTGVKEEDATGNKTKDQLWAEYNAIPNAIEQRAFYLKHKEILNS